MAQKAAIQAAMVYVAVAGAWIALSDRVLIRTLVDPSLLAAAQTVKGWAFVLVTATLLYGVLRRAMSAAETARVDQESSKVAATSLSLRLEHYVSASPTITYAMTVERGSVQILWISDNVSRILGVHPEEILAQSWWVEHLHPSDRSRVLADAAQLLDAGSLTLEYRLILSDGRVLWIRDEVRVAGNPDEETREIIGSWTDVTAAKRAEQRFRRTLENIPDVVVIYDTELRIRYINAATRRVTGHSADHFIGKTDEELFPPEVVERYLPTLRAAFESKAVRSVETELSLPDTATRFLRITCVPLVDDDGRVREVAGITHDLTEQRARERESRDLINGMNDTAFVIDFDAGFVEVNETAERTLGYSRSELITMGPADIDPSLPADEIKHLVRGMRTDDRQVFETCHRTKDGKVIPVEISSSRISFRGEPAVLSVARDLTERKRAEAERERLLSAIEQADEVIVITDPNGAVQYLNRAFERTTGYPRDEAIGRKLSFLKSGQHDDRFYRELWDTIGSGRTWQGRVVNRRKDGHLITEETTISPVHDQSGAIVNYVAAQRDITQELALEERYRQAQKMEAVGRLAGGIAHDFNNMLAVILGRVELLTMKHGSDDSISNSLNAIRYAAQRSAELTGQLLAYARKQVVVPKVLDLNHAIDDALRMLRRLIGEAIDLTWTLGASRPTIKIDPAQLDQIIANLCLNARDAINGVGRITVEISDITVNDEDCRDNSDLVPGRYAVLTVSDDGCGMDRETLANLFEPFFTTKAMGKGTGLGLATVYGIVKQNSGTIQVESEPSRGSTFRIYLPHHVSVSDSDLKQGAPVADTPVGGCEKILMVEDESSVLELYRETLSDLGYTILTAGSPDEALRIAVEYDGTLDLLITDVIMPGMNGLDLANRIRSALPGIKLLFVSGFAESELSRGTHLINASNFLSKPFSRNTFAAKVHEVLARRGT
jgi:PAS domain S-box-containing protein